MARYFKVTYRNGFQQQRTAVVSTISGTPANDESCKNYAFNTGFNGCKLESFVEIDKKTFWKG